MTEPAPTASPPSRRDEYAAATRQAVVDAARRLFAERGYVRTKVDDIARAARVSPATVYAQCGGKQGLLQSLMDQWTTGPRVEEALAASRRAATAEDKLGALGTAFLVMSADVGDIIRLVHQTAPHDADAAGHLAVARRRQREALRRVVRDVRGTGRLQDGLDDERAVDIVLFHMRHQQLSLLIDDLGWRPEEAMDWIQQRLRSALLTF
ncbi:TetR/AcrR family transcriptional regulator [Nakamurella endophytica]|uniref:TetR family transcriptional regulator n=1 Tax=Nakamurella endophytica TaxID=1748367 RepID=A0A917WFC3_9ACTN|nr:TetR/AcrR family transcriptional regulator [Nakamurella endophytica]GGL97752.1 TetR family transcriptional regulator [Nakamurella endophytica]